MPRKKELNEQMRAESQAQIMATARRLFAEQGYFNTKVTEIASQAGMSTGNVYWYYPGKEDLLKAVLADGFQVHQAVLAQAAAHPGTAQEKLDHLIDQYLRLCREQGEFFSILLAILGHGGPAYLETLGFDMREIGRSYHQHLTTIIAQGQAEGTILDVEPHILATFFFSLFNGLLLTYGQEWRDFPPGTVRAAVLRLLGGAQPSQ